MPDDDEQLPEENAPDVLDRRAIRRAMVMRRSLLRQVDFALFGAIACGLAMVAVLIRAFLSLAITKNWTSFAGYTAMGLLLFRCG